MSAYIVDKEHVLFLVEAGLSRAIVRQYGLSWCWDRNPNAQSIEELYKRGTLEQGDSARAAEVANMLWRENIRSVGYRYPHETSGTLPGPKADSFVITEDDFRSPWTQIKPVEVLKAIACYSYQTCEHPEWEASEAFAFCDALKHAAINALPGYDDAPWGAPKRQEWGGIRLSSLVKR